MSITWEEDGAREVFLQFGGSLIVAIIGLIAFALLNGKTQAVTDDINEATVQVLNLVTQNRSKINLSGAQQAA